MAEGQMPLLSEENNTYSTKEVPSWEILNSLYSKFLRLDRHPGMACQTPRDGLKDSPGARTQYKKFNPLFMLSVPERREKMYLAAFLELFQSQYTPHVGDAERLAGKKVRRLYVTLPTNYTN